MQIGMHALRQLRTRATASGLGKEGVGAGCEQGVQTKGREKRRQTHDAGCQQCGIRLGVRERCAPFEVGKAGVDWGVGDGCV